MGSKDQTQIHIILILIRTPKVKIINPVLNMSKNSKETQKKFGSTMTSKVKKSEFSFPHQHDEVIEDADTLRFPREFEFSGTKSLINSEVYFILKYRQVMRRKALDHDEKCIPENRYLRKSLDYTERFLKFDTEESII